ncbi:MAG: hypothetical protein H6706_19615 [Myxococcales bacterium]|nr:hypothetical protein [Myxococcales bacterium]
MAALLQKAGLRTRYVSPADLLQDATFVGATVYAQPGGDATSLVLKAVGAKAWPDAARRIRAFVAGGGRYLGICLGGWVAGPWMNDTVPALDLLDGEVDAFTRTPRDHTTDQVIPVTWLLPSQQRRVYFQEGPYFEARGTVYARYSDGSVATLLADFGRGKVAVSGIHLEAEADWYTANDLTDADGPDADLGVILIRALLAK